MIKNVLKVIITISILFNFSCNQISQIDNSVVAPALQNEVSSEIDINITSIEDIGKAHNEILSQFRDYCISQKTDYETASIDFFGFNSFDDSSTKEVVEEEQKINGKGQPFDIY